jgi:hypothetical protein
VGASTCAGEPLFMRAIRAVLLSAACAALMWSAALALFGGFKFRVLGVAIRSNHPDRALRDRVHCARWLLRCAASSSRESANIWCRRVAA